jgi:hypothetical protein
LFAFRIMKFGVYVDYEHAFKLCTKYSL